MTNPTPPGQVPDAIDVLRAHAENEALRAQQDDAYDHGPQAETVEEAARDVGKWLNERPNRPLDLRHVAMLTHHAKRTDHVQNPAEIEHVAGDVSKNGAELNMSAQQPAPQQEAQSALFDKQGFREWVLHNLPDDTIIGSSAHWADHLSAWAQRFVKAAPQQEPVRDAIDADRAARAPAESVGRDAILPELFREALAWGMTYGPEIPAHQWDQMRESMVNQYVSRAARAPAESVGRDAERLDFLIEQRAYVVSDPDTCPGYWLHFVHKETGQCWVQCDEHPTPRAAIDSAMAANGGHK